MPLFINIIFATFRGFLDKKIVSKVDPYLAFFYVSVASGLAWLLFYIVRHETFPQIYPEMMLMGILYTVVIGSYLYAIRINLSQTVIFSSYYLLISMFLSAVFLGEWRLFDPSTSRGIKTIFGVMFAFVSMVLILHAHTRKEEKMELKWLFFISINIVLNGIGSFWGKTFIDRHGPLETAFSQSVAGVPMLFLINFLKNKDFKIPKYYHLLCIINGVVIAFAVIFYYLALKNGPLSIVLPLQTVILNIVLVLIGLFVYKETHLFDKGKILGLILGGVGVILLMV